MRSSIRNVAALLLIGSAAAAVAQTAVRELADLRGRIDIDIDAFATGELLPAREGERLF